MISTLGEVFATWSAFEGPSNINFFQLKQKLRYIILSHGNHRLTTESEVSVVVGSRGARIKPPVRK